MERLFLLGDNPLLVGLFNDFTRFLDETIRFDDEHVVADDAFILLSLF